MTIIPMDLGANTRDPNAPDPLTEDELRGIIENEIRQAVNHSTSEIAHDQERALEYYEGRPFGNEVAGSSTVVLRDVAETIDWAMPALMRAFFYTSEIVRYEATQPGGEAIASLMTQVVNEIFRQNLRGFRVTYDWAKAGLLERFATVKFWIETCREPKIEIQTDLTAEGLVRLVADPDVEIIEQSERVETLEIQPGVFVEVPIFDVRIKRWMTYPKMRLETVPPEEFLCSRHATRLDQDIPFVAHQRAVTRSDLFSMGIPWELVARLPMRSLRHDGDGRAVTRHEGEDPDTTTSTRSDKASQEVTVTEAYVRVDFDGDGYSELRRVLTGGDHAHTLLEHDYAPMHGFAGWTPIPMPHKMYGRGYYDVVADLQRIRSTLARQLLDNIVRMNNARHKMEVEEVDLDSYLDTEPGAPVLVTRMDAIEPLEVPALPSWAFEALSYFEKVREQRTGIHPYSQEVYAAGQNQTAQGVSQVFEAAMAMVQLLAQMLGEGLTDLFRIIPRMIKASGMPPGRVKVGDQWIDYDPAQWPDDPRVAVQVGLSPGQTEQKIQRLLMLLGLQKEALGAWGEGYMVTAEQVYGTAIRIVEQSGFQSPGAFFMSPQGKEMPPAPPDPKQIAEEVNAKNLQAQRALDLAKLEFEREKEREQTARLERDAQREHERELLRIEMEREVRTYEVNKRFEAAQLQAQVAKAAAEEKEESNASE
jgi:hypothetical protein